MVRSTIAVIVSYILMFVLNVLCFVSMYAIMGPGQAFRPRSYLASNRWIAISVVCIFVSAVVAGFVCAAIARGGRAPLALAVVVVVLGLILAIPAMKKAKDNAGLARVSEVSQMEAANKAYWPIWAPFTFPFISAIGVLVGGKLKKRS